MKIDRILKLTKPKSHCDFETQSENSFFTKRRKKELKSLNVYYCFRFVNAEFFIS